MATIEQVKDASGAYADADTTAAAAGDVIANIFVGVTCTANT